MLSKKLLNNPIVSTLYWNITSESRLFAQKCPIHYQMAAYQVHFRYISSKTSQVLRHSVAKESQFHCCFPSP